MINYGMILEQRRQNRMKPIFTETSQGQLLMSQSIQPWSSVLIFSFNWFIQSLYFEIVSDAYHPVNNYFLVKKTTTWCSSLSLWCKHRECEDAVHCNSVKWICDSSMKWCLLWSTFLEWCYGWRHTHIIRLCDADLQPTILASTHLFYDYIHHLEYN